MCSDGEKKERKARLAYPEFVSKSGRRREKDVLIQGLKTTEMVGELIVLDSGPLSNQHTTTSNARCYVA